MLNFLAQYQDDGGAAAAGAGCFGCGCGLFMFIIWAAILVAVIAGFWKVFEKAGKPGWAAIVPIYNMIVLLEIAGKPLWWIVLFFLPVVNIVAGILVALEVAKRFGKEPGFGIRLALLPMIF